METRHFTKTFRSSRPEVFLGKGVLKICSKFTEHPCRSVISIKLLWNFIEVARRHGCSPVNLLHIFRTPFPKNTPGRLLLMLYKQKVKTFYLGVANSFNRLLQSHKHSDLL